MPEIVAGLNSYITEAEADTYLAGSVQWSTLWPGYTDAERQVALISAFRALEREAWEGEASAAEIVATATVSAGGTGYAVGDVLQILGGVFGDLCRVEVLTEAAGAVATVRVISVGAYSTFPTNPASSLKLTGAGDDAATFDLVSSSQVAEWPRAVAECPDLSIDPLTTPADIKAAQAELAAIFASDPSQAANVGAGGSGTSSNIQKVEAGSAKVTYFSPTSGTPYPTIVWQLMSGYREGACSTGGVGVGGFASGTGDVSAFTCPDARYGLNQGYA